MTSKEKYDSLIKKAKSENRVKGEGVYYEGHHIVPKCVGGKGHSNGWRTHPNIVLLTPQEHFWAHVWLIDMYPDHEYKMRWALQSMMNQKNAMTPRELEVEAELYAELRKGFADMVAKKQTGRTLPQETVEKIRQSQLKRVEDGTYVNPFKGKTHTPEMIKFYRESQLGEKSAMYGKKRDRDSVERGAAKLRGVPKSEEHRRNLSKAAKGRKANNRRFTDDQIRDIRTLKVREAKEKYGMRGCTYYRIVNRETYKEVK